MAPVQNDELEKLRAHFRDGGASVKIDSENPNGDGLVDVEGDAVGDQNSDLDNSDVFADDESLNGENNLVRIGSGNKNESGSLDGEKKKKKKKKKAKNKKIEVDEEDENGGGDEENSEDTKNNSAKVEIVPDEIKDAIVQAEAVAEEENKLSERAVYYSEYLVSDLEVVYGKTKVLGDAWKVTKERLSKYGIRWILEKEKRMVGTEMKFVRDMEKGRVLLEGIKKFFSTKEGLPENWDEVSKLAKASVIDLGDLEKARKVVDRDLVSGNVVVEDKDQVVEPTPAPEKKKKILYKDIGIHLRWVTGGDNEEKKKLALSRLAEEGVPVEKLKINKEDGLPADERRLLRAKVFWASKILEGQDVVDENKKRINPWPSKEEALNFLEDLLGVGIPDPEPDPEPEVESKGSVDIQESDQQLTEKSYEFGNKQITCKVEENVTIVDYPGIKGDLLLASSEKFRANASFAAVDKRLRDHGVKWELGISVVTKGG